MPKVKAKRKVKLNHNECRLRVCIWCGKKRSPGSLQNISKANLLLIQSHGDASLDPASDSGLPKVICPSCRLGLKELETPPEGGIKHHLAPLFDYE